MQKNDLTANLVRIGQWAKVSADYNVTNLKKELPTEYHQFLDILSNSFLSLKSRCQKEAEQLKQENKKLKEKIDLLTQSNNEQNEELIQLRNTKQLKKVSFSNDYFDLRKQNEKLAQENSRLTEQLNEKKNQTPQTTQKVTAEDFDTLGRYPSTVSASRFIEQNSSNPDNSRMSPSRLEISYKNLQYKYNSLKTTNDQLQRKINNMQDENRMEIQKVLYEHTNIENSLRSELRQLQVELQSSQRAVADRNNTLTKKDQRIDGLKGIIDKKDKELANVRMQLAEAEDSIRSTEDLVAENKRLHARNEELEGNSTRERINYLTSTQLVKAECTDQMRLAQRKISQLERALREAESKNADLLSTIREATENSKSVIHESSVLSDRVQELEKQKSQLESQLSVSQRDFDSQSISSQRELMQQERAVEQRRTPSQTQSEHSQEEYQRDEIPNSPEFVKLAQKVSEIDQKIENLSVAITQKDNHKSKSRTPKSSKDPANKQSKHEAVSKLQNALSSMNVPVHDSEDVGEMTTSLIEALEEKQHKEQIQQKSTEIPVKNIVKSLADVLSASNEETVSNGNEILRSAKKRILHLQKKYDDARNVIRTVKSIVQDTKARDCQSSLKSIFGIH